MTKNNLSSKICTPCQSGTPPLKGNELTSLKKHLHKDWKVIDEHHLERTHTFPNFFDALVFTNKLGLLAEKEPHIGHCRVLSRVPCAKKQVLAGYPF